MGCVWIVPLLRPVSEMDAELDRVRRLNRKRFCLVCGTCPVQIWPGQGTLLTEVCSNLSRVSPSDCRDCTLKVRRISPVLAN